MYSIYETNRKIPEMISYIKCSKCIDLGQVSPGVNIPVKSDVESVQEILIDSSALLLKPQNWVSRNVSRIVGQEHLHLILIMNGGFFNVTKLKFPSHVIWIIFRIVYIWNNIWDTNYESLGIQVMTANRLLVCLTHWHVSLTERH